MQKNIKNLIVVLTALLFTCGLQAQQVSIHPNGAATDSSAILDIIAADKGLLIPRMDSTTRKNIAGPAKGLMVFDSTYNSFWYYDGTAWTGLNGQDQQDLSLSNDVLSLSNDASTVSLGDYKQNLSVGVDDSLRLSNAPTAIDLAQYKDDLGNHMATQNIQLNNQYLSGDGGFKEGLYVDTLGEVRMNNSNVPYSDANFQYEFDLPLTTEAISRNAHDTTTRFTFWQSFTIPFDGYMTHFYYYGYYLGVAASFQLYRGEGPGGELVTSGGSIVPFLGGLGLCQFAYLPVYEGEVYTIVADPGFSFQEYHHVSTSNPYPGGRANYGPNYDMEFSLYILQPEAGYQFSDTALVLNEYRLPVTDGNPSDLLVTDGRGNVDWANGGSGALVDHLGNHTMSQNLQMNGYWINNDGGATEGLYIDSMGRVGINTVPTANLHVPMGPAPNPGFRIDDTGVTINDYRLPMADGATNQVLATNGAGIVNWVTPTGSATNQQLSLSSDILSLTDGGPPISLTPYLGGDNLGNHTASQNLYIDNFWIQNTANDTTGMFLNNLHSLQVVSSSARPAEFLITQPAVGNYIEVSNNANTSARLGAGGSDFIPGGDTLAVALGNFSATGDFNVWVGNAKRMQISAAGNVGIGRAATTNIFEVDGAASKSTAGNWLANSDARLKQNIQELESHEMLKKLLSLQGITYEWADEQTGMQRPLGIQYGFTAQNIQEVFPSLVSEDQQGYLQTAYDTYDAMTVEAIRALNHKLEKLDSQTSALELEMDAMSALKSKIQKSSTNK